MSNAVTRLSLVHIPASHWTERTRWRLAEPVMVCGQRIPEGFTTDGASVPRLLWWLFPPHGRYMAAAVLHDYLLRMPQLRRAEADRQFLQVMRQMGVARWRRLAMFAAVRLWGSVKEVLRG
jgi:hypothetical protein